MKSLTIHNLDDDLYQKIKLTAKKNHRSMNQEIKEKLFAFFLKEKNENIPDSFRKFSGLWNDEDYKQFTLDISDFNKIDESDWKL